jgi:hypothetical protein
MGGAGNKESLSEEILVLADYFVAPETGIGDFGSLWG